MILYIKLLLGIDKSLAKKLKICYIVWEKVLKKSKEGVLGMRMEKRRFRIGELAQKLNLEKFVIRFWEKEFNLKPHRSDGKQRFYEEKDLEKFQQIKSLLYENGFTIAGARKQLGSNRVMASQKTSFEEKIDRDELLNVKDQLIKLRELL